MTPSIRIALYIAAAIAALYLLSQSVSHFAMLGQEFDTVAPSRFVVTAVPLAVNDAVRKPLVTVTDTEEQPFQNVYETVLPSAPRPVLTSIGSDMPAVTPTLVPTTMPAMRSSDTVTVWP